jgi:hypothetical protein
LVAVALYECDLRTRYWTLAARMRCNTVGMWCVYFVARQREQEEKYISVEDVGYLHNFGKVVMNEIYAYGETKSNLN